MKIFLWESGSYVERYELFRLQFSDGHLDKAWDLEMFNIRIGVKMQLIDSEENIRWEKEGKWKRKIRGTGRKQ